ncbi:uncharacterized protein [Atheta coriaria]|uniref:uncharacterized protein isoform X1 n=1 Tax=Dalotia coriaria TaxID=877792 RepID=UPI0031F3EB22
MKTIIVVVLAYAMTIFTASAIPAGYGGYGYSRQVPRLRRGYQQQPQAMMFSGFYGQPSSYGHQGSMSAFANKDMIFTNSFAGEEAPIYLNNEQTNEKEVLSGPNEQEAPIEEEIEVQTTTKRPSKVKKNKRKPTTTVKPVEEVDHSEEDEEEDQETPFRGSNNANRPGNPGNQAGNTFFPVIFGKSQNGGGGPPGAAIAIANAFSTGKGGVASSHATAYGDPYFSRMGNKNNGNKNKKN